MNNHLKPGGYEGLKAVFFNGTLKPSPQVSNTDGLIRISRVIMEKQGVTTSLIRTVDHDIASGVYPDMREHGWKTDEWPEIYPMVAEADIVSSLAAAPPAALPAWSWSPPVGCEVTWRRQPSFNS